jgi:uncharacterized protein YggU (UPF0235/DUF167 family)
MKKPSGRKSIAKHNGSDIDSFCAWEGDTLVLNVLGKPAATRDAIGKPIGLQLNISVTESPVRGRATDHMVHVFGGAVRGVGE